MYNEFNWMQLLKENIKLCKMFVWKLLPLCPMLLIYQKCFPQWFYYKPSDLLLGPASLSFIFVCISIAWLLLPIRENCGSRCIKFLYLLIPYEIMLAFGLAQYHPIGVLAIGCGLIGVLMFGEHSTYRWFTLFCFGILGVLSVIRLFFYGFQPAI